MTDLTGKVAAITGGTRGIGRGLAEAFLAGGASVAINGRSAAKGEQALAEMQGGDRLAFFAGDVTNRDDVNGFIDQTIDRFGQVDILVNNAGGSSGFALVEDMSDDAWEQAAAWILHSCFWATKRALKDMKKRNWGRVINISSVEGRQANKATASHYITFKHAMNGFTKAVAFEYGETGITSNAISPGAVETDLMMETGPKAAESMGISYEQFKENYAQEAAIKRLNTVEEVAGLAMYLVSDAGGGVTGAIMPVDGGTAL